jgi:hypothetical protein
MRILGGLVVVILAAWLVAKVAMAAFKGLVHLLVLSPPYL